MTTNQNKEKDPQMKNIQKKFIKKSQEVGISVDQAYLLWEVLESSLLSQKKELKLKAQSLGTPDGYVNIEKLFDDTPDMDLKEVLEKL